MIPPAVLLMSGIKIDHPTSFSRQLTLLAGFLKGEGVRIGLTGPIPVTESARTRFSRSGRKQAATFRRLVEEVKVGAAILLGYPDQFPFLRDAEPSPARLFIWAQLSDTIDSGSLGAALAVPLTEKTERFLALSGTKDIGPVIPHGVDCSIYRPLPTEERAASRSRFEIEKGFVVGTVGAHSARKKLSVIIEAFGRLRSRRNDCVLLVKTDRTVSADGGDLERLARMQGVSGDVRFVTGELGEDGMNQLYNAMDLYLNLSEWEGFCIPVAEAMSCGVPVACPPIQGPAEIVPYRDLLMDGGSFERTGERRLFHADPAKTALSLLRASEQDSLLRLLGRKGRREALERYDIRIVARLWEGLLTKRCPA
jgi:glycosyltransferase involved in cell wall biosynthesis